MAYSVENMASQRTLRPKREVRNFILGKIFLQRNPELEGKHFQTRLKLKDLYPRKLLKMRLLCFLLYDFCLFLKVKIVKVFAIIFFLMPSYVKNKTKCTLILELVFTSVSD